MLLAPGRSVRMFFVLGSQNQYQNQNWTSLINLRASVIFTNYLCDLCFVLVWGLFSYSGPDNETTVPLSAFIDAGLMQNTTVGTTPDDATVLGWAQDLLGW
jgi:hypothetical protein